MVLKTSVLNSAEFLDSEEAVQEYISAAFETEDPAFIAKCLGTVASARNMSQLSRDIGMSRPALYKALSGEGNPEFGTIMKILHALNIKLTPKVGETASTAA